MSNKRFKKDQGEKVPQSPPNSEDSFSSPKGSGEEQTRPEGQQSKYGKWTVAAGTTGLLSIIFVAYRYFIPPNLQTDGLQERQFQFAVFCPINQVKSPSKIQIYSEAQSAFAEQLNDLRLLTEQFSSQPTPGIDQYLIYVQMRNTTQASDSNVLAYCSYVTDWNSRNCSEAKPLCSYPGPIFYVERNKPIEVAWVYNINSTGKNFSNTYGYKCYDKSNDRLNLSHCYIHQRKPGYEGCTYLDPTDLIPGNTYSKTFKITTQNIPMVAHVHGLEVRPSFDGNPLAWLGKNGKVGMGFTTLSNSKYYGLFRDPMSTSLLLDPSISYLYVKVNRYDNFQAPGNLWYHDHSMHATRANVALGMAGDYIIHDPEIDRQLPQGEYEILIVAGQNFNKTNSSQGTVPRVHGVRVNPDIPFAVETNLTFKRNQTYRIRILNGQYDSTFLNLQFLTECQQQPNIDPTTCKKRLSFSVIGSDSCLFDKSVRSDSLNVSSAERYEILIVFDGSNKGFDCDKNTGNLLNCQNTISPSTKQVLLISKDSGSRVHNTFNLEPRSTTPNVFGKLPSQVQQIGGPFYDLTSINNLCKDLPQPVINPTRCLNTIRMRPFFRDTNFAFFFNGHYDFSQSGASDNPKIGTTEDWYFINTMGFGHPIHVHLINYQIVGMTTLKMFNNACSFYEMDFYINGGVVSNDANLTKVCQNVRALDITQAQKILFNKYLENTTNGINDPVSGLDVRQAMVSQEDFKRYSDSTNCKDSTFKYVCNPFSADGIPAYQRKWKQVAFVDAFIALQVRIRWTSTQYDDRADPSNPPYPYFNVPEDQLLEHPGYVYHCHFLQHEDNELMRSFMMQPSDKFAANYPVEGTELGDCMARRGLKNEDGWKARYQCINELSGCPVARA